MDKKFYIFFLFLAFPFFGKAQQQNIQDSLVEVSGVTLTADSTFIIPDVSILIKGKNRGTISNNDGVFSIVVLKGDILIFRAIGFKTQLVKIPGNLRGNHYGLAQLMTQDTTYLPVTVVKPYPTRDEFKYAFLHWKIPMDKYEIARNNTSLAKLKSLSYFTPPDGGEGVNRTFRQQFQQAEYKGGYPPMNIFNPFAWAKFIKALKDGDFKRKD